MSEDCIRIEKLTNGFEVEIKDPAIVKANARPSPKNGPYTPYRDPWKCFVFKTEAEVLAFLKKNLSKVSASGGDDYESSFAVASGDD